jgi:hypothetical protein
MTRSRHVPLRQVAALLFVICGCVVGFYVRETWRQQSQILQHGRGSAVRRSLPALFSQSNHSATALAEQPALAGLSRLSRVELPPGTSPQLLQHDAAVSTEIAAGADVDPNSCNATFTRFPNSVDLRGVRRRYGIAKLSPVLIEMLAKYKRRVSAKIADGSRKDLWGPYADAVVDVDFCFDTYPECSVWNRTEVQIGADSNHIDGFMVRKCCIEHHQMLRALRSLHHAFWGADLGGGEVASGAWLTAGTLLGAAREGGVFVPWDTDVDVLIEPRHEVAVTAMLRKHGATRRSFSSSSSPPTMWNLDVVEPEDEDDPSAFVATAFSEVKEHAHGRLVGVLYGSRVFRHEEASRVEIWVAQETKKMQRSIINLPVQKCRMYDLSLSCPADPLAVLFAGYGPYWCVPCKSRSQNCKAELAEHFSHVAEGAKL